MAEAATQSSDAPARPPPTLSRALLWPRWVLSVLELVVTFLVLLGVFGSGRGFFVVLAAAFLPSALLLLTQALLDQHRTVGPIDRLTRKGLESSLSELERRELAEALVRYPRRVVYVRFMGWATTTALLLTVCSALSDLDWPDLFAITGVCFAAALFFLLVRAVWFRRAAAKAVLPALSGADPHRYLGRTLRERLFVAAFVPGTVGAIVAGLYNWLFLELHQDRVRALFATLPLLVLALVVVFAYLLFRWTAPVRAHLAARALQGPEDGPWRLVRPVDDPGALLAIQRATSLPYRTAGLSMLLWAVAGAYLGVEHAAVAGTWQEGVLLFAGIASVAMGAAVVQFSWTRRVMQPARELCARELGAVPLADLRPRLRVQWRFVAVVMVVLFASTTLAYSTLYLQQRALMAAAAGAEGRSRLDELWPTLEPLSHLDPDARLAAALSLANGSQTLVLAEHGKLAWSSKPVILSAQARADLEAGRTEIALRTSRQTIALRTLEGGGAIGVVMRWRSFEGAFGAFGLTVLVVVVTLLAVFIALMAADDFTAPIRSLRAFARRLGRGELDAPLPVSDADELGELGLTLDKMRQDLRAQLDAVRELNLGLERKVAERTAELERALAELHEAQAQMLQSEKLASVGRLAAGVAHEINNPLNFIANALGPLEEMLADVREVEALESAGKHAEAEAERRKRQLPSSLDELKDLLRLMRNGTQRTQQIVRGLRDFSRRDEGEKPKETDLAALCDETLALLRHELAGRIEVVRDYAADTRIPCYPGALGQLFMNLLANAAQAISGRGTITVSIGQVAGALEFSVRDTGSGIPADVLPKIFDPFFTTKEVGRGTGLGLSIAHGIVERHGGRISVESTVGVGTVFTVRLPLGRDLARSA